MRLTRMGSKKRPHYRVIVTDARSPRDGRHVDIVGFYNPMTQPTTINIDTERAVQWLRNGAQPTERVRILLRHAGVLKAHEEARLADRRARKAAEAEAGGPAGAVRAGAGAAVEAVTDAASTVADAAASVADAAGDAAAALASAAGKALDAVADATVRRGRG
jgi:small subunit ribosomal protein S16